MLLAILSDSHDAILNLRRAVELANERKARYLLHCGDLISPFMVLELARFKGEVHFILGNNPGDVWLVGKQCARFPHIHFHGQYAFEELDGLKVAIVHFPELAEGLALTGKFDLVCCGHTHVYEVKELNSVPVINPGEILGKEGPPTMVFFDSETRQIEKVTFDEGSR